ncbi:MAG: glycosyltransferase family 4 protein [Pseudomonadota bacterium]
MSPRIRVASVYSYMCVGGDENRLLQYLAARDTARFEHLVVSCLAPTEASLTACGPIQGRFRELGVELVQLDVPADHEQRQHAGSFSLAAIQGRAFARVLAQLTRLLRARRIDVVDARLNLGTVLGTLAGRAAGVGAVVSTNYVLERFENPLWYPLGQATYAGVDALICDSRAYLDRMRAWMLRPPPGRCIPNGIHPPVATRAAAAVRAELGIPEDARVIAQIARVRRIKGQDLLLEAAPRVLAAVPEAFFVICGYSQLAESYRQELDGIVAKHGIAERVRIFGYPGPIGDLWPLVEIHAHPTRLDSSPLALMEGMSLGRPAVTTPIGGIPEIVVDGESGLLVPPEDPERLGAALIRLLREPALAARLGSAARARYEARHRPEVMARSHEALFEEVLRAPRHARLPWRRS